MRNFQDTFETRKRSFISAFSICMTVPLIVMIATHHFQVNLQKLEGKLAVWNSYLKRTDFRVYLFWQAKK